MQNLISVNQLVEIDNEARIRDVDLAIRLGMVQPLNIRTVIAANRDELETYGSFHVANENPGRQGGRPSKAYYLNEGQALVICALSRTEKAVQVRKLLIDVFMAYRQGKLVHVKEHRRKPPCRKGDDDSHFERTFETLYAFCDQPDALIQVLARCVVRLDQMESRLSR